MLNLDTKVVLFSMWGMEIHQMEQHTTDNKNLKQTALCKEMIFKRKPKGRQPCSPVEYQEKKKGSIPNAKESVPFLHPPLSCFNSSWSLCPAWSLTILPFHTTDHDLEGCTATAGTGALRGSEFLKH